MLSEVFGQIYIVYIGANYVSLGIEKKKEINLIRSEESLDQRLDKYPYFSRYVHRDLLVIKSIFYLTPSRSWPDLVPITI